MFLLVGTISLLIPRLELNQSDDMVTRDVCLQTLRGLVSKIDREDLFPPNKFAVQGRKEGIMVSLGCRKRSDEDTLG